MGWKTLKQHFGIEHIVQVTEKGSICIGSAYIHDLVVIDPKTGKLDENQTFSTGFLRQHYPELLATAPAEIVKLIDAQDVFDASVPVFTYRESEIIEKRCEEPGWPNVTHDGCVMYESAFSTDKVKVIKWAHRKADLRVKYVKEQISRTESDLAALQKQLTHELDVKARLEAVYPATETRRDDTSDAGIRDLNNKAPTTLRESTAGTCYD